jgi:hypothetical protein
MFFSFDCFGQSSIAAKAFVKDGKVMMRWVPSDYSTLIACSKKGYLIKRILWSGDGKPDSAMFRNAPFVQNITPFSTQNNSWKDLASESDDAAFLYNVLYKQSEKEANETGMFFGLAMLGCDLNVLLAEGAGLYFKDENAERKVLAYMIQPMEGKLRRSIIPAIIVVDVTKNDILRNIDSVSAVVKDKEVKLVWNNSDLKPFYPGYFIDRSESDGKNFVTLNKRPHVFIKTQYEKDKKEISYNDTAAEYGKTYYYRVRGLSFFGIYGNYSNIVKVKVVKPLSNFAVIDSTQLVRDSLFRIYWHKPHGVNAEEILGYSVYRSRTDNGPYARLNKKPIKDVYEFLDERPYKSTFYKLVTYNIYGDSIASFPFMSLIPDKSPPKIPVGFKGQIDTTGKVRLTWIPNKESDLKGYRIFRNNAPDEEPVEITRVIWRDTVYLDTVDINTLTEEVYYFITAVDEVYNNSPYSKSIKLRRPDKIKPVGVVFNELYHKDSVIVLAWIPSTSKDVVNYELYRRTNNEFQKIISWNGRDSLKSYHDDKIIYGNYYQYKIRVYDEGGNFSESISSSHYYDSRLRKPISKINYTVDREKKSVTLKWEYPEKDVFNYVLYRAKKGEELKSFRTLKAQTSSYVDKELYIGNVYIYKLKANFNSGAESFLSKEIEVIY